MENALLEVKGLKKYFKMGGRKVLHAVDDVSFSIAPGETLGIVGESGCGKSTCGRTCIGLYAPTAGQVIFKGKRVHGLKKEERKTFTKQAQMIFQDPYSSLDPRMKVRELIAEGIRTHRLASGEKEIDIQVAQLLDAVGLGPDCMNRYPHEFSGGQRQRIGIARTLAVKPDFIICDEPISALDVSVQAQIVNLLLKLQKERNLTYMFIAHDLAMVKYISDRVMVMYLGKVMEITTAQELYSNPLHPYTKALLSAIPIPDPKAGKKQERIRMEGEIPSPVHLPEGCRFQNRCPYASEKCRQEEPVLTAAGKEHYVACHHI